MLGGIGLTHKLTMECFLGMLITLLPCVLMAQEMSREELEAWFEDDSQFSPLDKVNEGDLVFLVETPKKPPLHSINRIEIQASSLETGWVMVDQCYKNLDAVAVAQVVYQYKQIKELKITKKEKIKKAWVEGQSVQLEDTQKGAGLCVSAKAKVLYKSKTGKYVLKNGPFKRKFLDGYYPMRVSLQIRYPEKYLSWMSSRPKAQKGFDVTLKPGVFRAEALFEGALFTEVVFEKPAP